MGPDGGKTRVVVTGLGAVTPLGNSVPEYWRAICEGRSGVGPITRFDPKRLDARIAAEVKGFDPLKVIEKKELKKLDLFIQYALAAGVEAVEDAKVDFSQMDPARAGALVGSGIGGILSILEWHRVLLEKGPSRISPFFIPSLIVNMASGQLSIRYKLKGPNSSVVTACATGNHAIGDAFKIIQRGDADLMVAGGSEAIIDELPIGGFAQMKALSTRNDEPDAGLAALRRRPRRIRARRGGGNRRAGECRARPPARRARLRGDRRVRHDGRRLPHDRARPGR